MTFDPQHPTQPEPVVQTDPVTPDPGVTSPPTESPPAPAFAPVRPEPVGPATTHSRSGRWLNVVLAFAILFAVGGVAFAVGRTTAPETAATTGRFGGGAGRFPTGSGAPALGNGAAGQNGAGGFAGFGRGNGLTISGTVASISGGTMTITTANGQTLDVTLDSDTTYSTKSPASSSDVTAGSTVEVQLDVAGAFRGGGNGGQGGNATGSGAPTLTASGVTVVP